MMDHFAVIISLIGVMFVLIIGLYIWTFAKMGEVYKIVNGHIQKSNIHGETKEFVSTEVFTALHGALKEDVIEIKRDVKKLLVKAGV